MSVIVETLEITKRRGDNGRTKYRRNR